MKVYLIGVGLGNPDTMTVQARRAAEGCPVLIGAPRLLAPWAEGHTCLPLVAAAGIAEEIRRRQEGPVGVLLSGDTGFYSGAKALRPLLAGHEVETLPGVSSLSYFCARLGVPWEDVKVVSAHGRSHNAPGEIQRNEKTFVLTGGQARAEQICRALADRGLGDVRVSVGERLSYPEERITTGTAAELAAGRFDGLAVLLAVNPNPVARPWNAPGLPDGAFLRGETPMTKEEVRALALCKLRPEPWHTVWDVGAGTGSVSVELALACPAGRVFAVERDPAALELIARNAARFGLPNLTVAEGSAPEALADLPAPDRVFIGGSGGGLEEILKVILQKNPAARVTIAAITLETLGAAVRCCEALGLDGVDVVQVSITRARRAGPYHMAQANNPVWLISGEGRV